MGGSTTTSRSLYSSYRDRHNDQGQTSPASLPSASGETPEFTYEPIQNVPDTPPLATFDFSSFQPAPSSGLAVWRGMAAGGAVDEAVRLARGRVLEDYYPSQYLPGVGRQVMADGGVPQDDYQAERQLIDYANELNRNQRRQDVKDALSQTWPVQLAKSVVSAATAPRDAYVRGMDTNEMVSRAQDMTGLIAGGGFAGTPKGAMGTSGTRIIRPDYSLVRGAVPNEVPSHLYMTERGSVYSNYPNFTSIRYKAARPEHPGEHGLQSRSMKTVFMDDAALNRVGGLHQNHEFPGYFMPIPDQKGRAAIYMTEDYGPVRAGTMYPKTEVPYSMIPERGLSPVEIFNPFSPRGIHFGNRIIDIE